MDGQRFGAGIKALRRHRRWRQVDLSAVAGLSQQAVSRIERGHVAQTSVARLEKLAAAMEAQLLVRMVWRGGELDRITDARHAALAEATVARLRSVGWQTAVEVSYSEYGERGSIDVLAWFALARVLLVIEVKSTLTSLEETNRRHDQKVRLAGRIARARFGWHPTTVARILVLPNEATARRRVAKHVETFDSVLPVRGRALTQWLRDPTGTIAGIWFVSPTHRRSGSKADHTMVRVRSRRSRAS